MGSKPRKRSLNELILAEYKTQKRLYTKIPQSPSYDDILERKLPKIEQNYKFSQILRRLNVILENELEEYVDENEYIDVEDLYFFIYCAAKTAVKMCKIEGIKTFNFDYSISKLSEDAEVQAELHSMSPNLFYQSVMSEDEVIVDSATREKANEYCRSSWEIRRDPTEEAHIFLAEEERRIRNKDMKEMPPSIIITSADFARALKKLKNWSNPGFDGLQIFWFKKFTSTHSLLVKKINEILRNPQILPPIFKQFITVLKASGSSYKSRSYVSSFYKIINKCVRIKIIEHFARFNILAEVIMGDRKGFFGPKTAIVVDLLAQNEGEVWSVFCDYDKAYDRVPHLWILKVLKLYQVCDDFLNYLGDIMNNWKSKVLLQADYSKKLIECDFIEINNGIISGDPLNSLLFIASINPISFYLSNLNLGLNLKNQGTISHIFYSNSAKIYASNFENLNKLFDIFMKFNTSIQLRFNYNKSSLSTTSHNNNCASLNLKSAPEIQFKLAENLYSFTTLDQAQFFSRVRKILDTKLEMRFKITLINRFALNALIDSFAVLFREEADLSEIVYRLIIMLEVDLPYKDIIGDVKAGGLGLIDLHFRVIQVIIRMRISFYRKRNFIDLYNFLILNDKSVTVLNLNNRCVDFNSLADKLYVIPEIWEVSR